MQYYKSTRDLQLKAIKSIDEKTALTEGYATKEHRVYKLSLLAAMMEQDLLGGILWTNQVKGIGGAENFEVVEYEEFNKAEVDSYRGVLDDIAAETGGRVRKAEVTGAGGKDLIPDDTERHDNILRKLAGIAAATGAKELPEKSNE